MTSTPPADQNLFEAASDIAREAVAYVKAGFRQDFDVEIKGDGSEVTEIDKGAEQLVRRLVAERFPDDTVIGEEAGVSEGTSGRRWIVDPIDGTASFVRRVPLFSTLLAVYDEHGPAVGIVAIPALDEFVAAGRGLGCFHNGAPTRVSDIANVQHSCISASAFDGSWWPTDSLLAISDSGAKTRTWGDGYGYFLVATGRVEAMVEPSLNTWDIAPMLVVIPEAGGRITTWTGTTDLEQGAGWIASNGRLHDEILGLVTDA
ncbi:MAG: inositol monophosphatase family protein [Actinomycetota bacterium]